MNIRDQRKRERVCKEIKPKIGTHHAKNHNGTLSGNMTRDMHGGPRPGVSCHAAVRLRIFACQIKYRTTAADADRPAIPTTF